MQKTDKICKLYFAILKNLAFFPKKICIFQKIVVILQRQKKLLTIKNLKNMITKVFRTMHAIDGKFTYTDQDGNIIIANSKRCYDYFSPVAYACARGCAFGTYKTCTKAISDYKRAADDNYNYLLTHKNYWTSKYGEEDYNKCLLNGSTWIHEAATARVIKIEAK